MPERPLADVLHQAGQVAAIADDDGAQFPPQRMVRHDAEVPADVGDDGADRAAADPGCDLLGCGHPRVKPGDKGIVDGGGVGGWRLAVGGRALRRGRGVQAGGVADDPGFECLGAEEAAGDVREDHGDICGAERVGVVAERGGKVSAVVDERTDESEEAAGAAGFGVGGGLGGGHVGQMSMGPGLVARNFFLEEF